ncbi:CBS domain-containing protein [Actinocorallia longicatena]|uniref:CBS domain-containing protein n=1 Tax=Actinocorallia longicatena TaxID=111803 RepID=A0ABP6Q2H6_9ACTN
MRRTTVGDVMTRDVARVLPDTAFMEIVKLLAERRISGVPVIHPVDGRPLGVISETDLLAKEEYKSPELDRPSPAETWLRRRQRDKAEAFRAADLMTAPAVTVTLETTVIEAACLMDFHGYNRLPVVDRRGRLAGIVARSDLLKVFLRPDAEIREEISREVLEYYLRQDLNLLTVRVRDGVVELDGQVDRRSLIPVAVRLASAVEGVTRVVENMTFVDDTADAMRCDTDTNRGGLPDRSGLGGVD